MTKETFLSDLEKQFACARALEIVGEASAKLPEEFRLTHLEIDWRSMKAMRNVLIHEYAYVDPEEIWKTYISDVPLLKEKIKYPLSNKSQ